MSELKLVVLGSTRGTNMQAIIDAIDFNQIDASIELVISNRKSAYILQRAQEHNIFNKFVSAKDLTRERYDELLVNEIQKYNPDIVLLIGFMRILSPVFIKALEGKILNIHPSLLPKYAGGMNNDVHRRVLDAKDKETGCTIHVVTKDIDKGPVLVQKKCPVFRHDTVASLKKRVQKLEGEAFVEAIKKIGLSNE